MKKPSPPKDGDRKVHTFAASIYPMTDGRAVVCQGIT